MSEDCEHNKKYVRKVVDLAPKAPIVPLYSCPTATATPTCDRLARPLAILVPIIAPPLDHFPRLPLSKEVEAKLRLKRVLEREQAMRQRDGLTLDFLAENSASSRRSICLTGAATLHDRAQRFWDQYHRSKWECILGIGRSLRKEAIDWILHVLPPVANVCSMPSSPTQSNTRSPPPVPLDLFDQLTTSPETRFHAAYMFIRFFFLVMPDLEMDRSEWQLVISDIAIGCLALSVKAHRDTLNPLKPIYANEFQALAPHDLSLDDLEESQRHLFFAFAYSLGDTPQAYLGDLWHALPSLRQLLDFPGGWSHVTKETWIRLFESIREPDVLRFPLSVLTASVLADALVSIIIARYEFVAEWQGETSRSSTQKTLSSLQLQVISRMNTELLKNAMGEIEGVVQDVQAVLDITDSQLATCRQWFRRVGNS